MKWFSADKQQAKVSSGAHPLMQTELFCDLTERELKIVDGFVHRRDFLAGEVVFDEGEEGQALYVIVSGKVAICLPGRQDTPLAELQNRDFFGELGLLDGWPRSAQARAVMPSELIVLARADFEHLMQSHARIASRIAFKLAHHLGQRLRQMLAQSTGEGAVL